MEVLALVFYHHHFKRACHSAFMHSVACFVGLFTLSAFRIFISDATVCVVYILDDINPAPKTYHGVVFLKSKKDSNTTYVRQSSKRKVF